MEYKNRVEVFNLEKFFSSDCTKLSYGASGVITPNQMIFLLNDNNGIENHRPTFDSLYSYIYNFKNDEEKVFVQTFQNIEIKLWNEKNNKIIFILFPPSITQKQLQLLEYFNNCYSDVVENYCKNGVCFVNSNFDTNISGDFNEAIKYASSIVNNDKIIINENILLGTNLDNSKKL